MELLTEYMARGFITMLMISMPCVLTAAFIGLIVGILQAVTQVQEQTIAAAPKILSVFLVIIIGGLGFIRLLTNLTSDGFAMAFNVIPKNENYALPTNYYKYTRPFQGEMKDSIPTSGNLNEKMENTSRFNTSSLRSEEMQHISPQKMKGSKPNFVEQKKILGR